jgi:hypothetical protein
VVAIFVQVVVDACNCRKICHVVVHRTAQTRQRNGFECFHSRAMKEEGNAGQ